jgi:tetrahydromethanopterin S-methyltransferase subunit C
VCGVVLAVYVVVTVVYAVVTVVYVVVVDVEVPILERSSYSSCSLGIDLDCLPKQPRD